MKFDKRITQILMAAFFGILVLDEICVGVNLLLNDGAYPGTPGQLLNQAATFLTACTVVLLFVLAYGRAFSKMQIHIKESSLCVRVLAVISLLLMGADFILFVWRI